MPQVSDLHPGWILHDNTKAIDIHPGDKIMFVMNFETMQDGIHGGWLSYKLFRREVIEYGADPVNADSEVFAYKIMRLDGHKDTQASIE